MLHRPPLSPPLVTGSHLTLTREALDVEMDVLDTHHLALADLPAAVTADGRGARASAAAAAGAAAAAVGAGMVRTCWRRERRHTDMGNQLTSPCINNTPSSITQPKKLIRAFHFIQA